MKEKKDIFVDTAQPWYTDIEDDSFDIQEDWYKAMDPDGDAEDYTSREYGDAKIDCLSYIPFNKVIGLYGTSDMHNVMRDMFVNLDLSTFILLKKLFINADIGHKKSMSEAIQFMLKERMADPDVKQSFEADLARLKEEHDEIIRAAHAQGQ